MSKPTATTKTRTKSKASIDLGSVLATAPRPTDAAGLGRARGLGVNEGVDALLGLGFPFMVIPVDGEVGTFATCGSFWKAFPEGTNVMPREAIDVELAIRMPDPDAQLPMPGDPVPAARSLTLATALGEAIQFGDGRDIQLLEAVHGSLPTADELVRQLADLPTAMWLGELDRSAPAVISAGLRFLLWRVPSADRTRLLATLSETFARIAPQGLTRAGKALDVLLHGRSGVERSGSKFNGKLHLYDLVSAEDDPQWACDTALSILATLRPADRESFNPQLVVLCGPKLLAAFRASVDKFPSGDRAKIRERLALFA